AETAWLQRAPAASEGQALGERVHAGARLVVPGYPAALGERVHAGARLVVPAIPEPEAWPRTLAALAAATIAEGRSVILAVPDRRDLERLAAAVAAAVGAEQVVRLDADQPAAARYRAFLQARSRPGLAIVGTRSVVYAPAQDLGLLAVWDDGDPAYQEPLAPGAHARDAALVRQELEGCALVLLAHSPSAEAERLVEVGWCERVGFVRRPVPRVIPTAMQTGGDRIAEQARIPSSAWRSAADALANGPVLVQVSRPGDETPGGSQRTATELGRAFPQAKVVVADGTHRVDAVGPEPALVIATRGAEPVAAGGYRAVLLLDGDRMLGRESLRVVEDALRTWSNAIALAAPAAPIHLVGVGGAIGAALAQWRQPDVVRGELAERALVRLPPAVRTATLLGSPAAVGAAVAAAGIAFEDVIGPVAEEDGVVRTIVRFDYRRGAEVATALRTEILRHATGRRTASRTHPQRSAALRVRMDDPEPFVGRRFGTAARGGAGQALG
ncbi:MAG: primosomal protein N', partial [Microbacteriaceae bacterium]|nr:primosomal protein N' [Microbacteriaceae bacterium]